MRLMLSHKVFGLVFLCSIAMIIGMAFLGFRLARFSIEENVSVLMTDKMTNVMHQVDELLSGYQTQLQIIATDQVLQSTLSAPKIADEQVRSMNARLSGLLIYSGPWDDLAVADVKGGVVAVASVRTGNKIISLSPEERALLSKANGTQVTYSDAYEINGERAFSYVTAMRALVSGKERVIGYVVGRIAWRSVEDILGRGAEGITLHRGDGTVIARSSASAAVEQITPQEVVSSGEQQVATLNVINGVSYMVTIVHEQGIPSFLGNEWILAGTLDVTSYVASNERNIQQIILVAAAAMLLLAIAISLILGRIVTKPVGHLRLVATAMARGDFNQKVKIESHDEIGDLASSFSEMATRLSDLYGSLEQRVKDKTEELERRLLELAESKKATDQALTVAEDAEEKTRQKSKQVEDAFNEVQRFARAADRERLTYSLLISSIGEGVVVVNPEGKITVTNGVAARIVDSSSADLNGALLFDVVELYTPDKKLVNQDSLRAIFAEGKLYNFRYWVMRRLKDNVDIVVSGVIAPLVDERSGGIVRGAIFTFRNVVEEKILEDARIGFISTASHQLRTPLTSMRWFAEMLHDGDAGEVNDDQKHFLERISEGIERMVGLVNMLLQIARIEAGRTSIEPVPMDLKEVVLDVAKTIEVQLKEHGQQVVVTADPPILPKIPLDKDYPWQVIQNLLTNAQRYAFDNTTIEVGLSVKDDFMFIRVKDSGIGIPKEAQPRLFEKFYRAENALAKVPTGTGLGLSLAKMLVDEMGGTLGFESEENIGTTFIMTIPLTGMEKRRGDVKLSV